MSHGLAEVRQDNDRALAEAKSPLISVIIPVYNSSDCLQRCLQAVTASVYPNYECIVADDSSTDDSSAVAKQFGVQVLELAAGPHGPAWARNHAAELAQGEILFFVDADVIIQPDTLNRVADTFVRRPDIAALFGAYDASPDAGNFISQYKNLFHHFVHQQAREDATTFWSGCGAVRRRVFLQMGGFDAERYPRPCIEDIELGYRLTAAGHRIVLNKEIQVKHLKRWTLRSLVRSDVVDRGIPWTLLSLRFRHMPSDLNLHLSQRLSAALLCVLLLHLGLTAFFHNLVLLPLLAGLFLVVVGYWHWPEAESPPWPMGWRSKTLSLALITVIVGVSLYLHSDRILLPVAFLLLGVLADRWSPLSERLSKHLTLALMMFGLVTAFALLLISFPLWLLGSLPFILGLILVLNYQFYAFFIQQRGIIFTLAVVPFHLLYYLYSVLAFAVGAGLYLWQTRRAVPLVGPASPSLRQ